MLVCSVPCVSVFVTVKKEDNIPGLIVTSFSLLDAAPPGSSLLAFAVFKSRSRRQRISNPRNGYGSGLCVRASG